MTSELVIDVKAEEISIALLEDKNLVEYQTETTSQSFSVGNIYLAKEADARTQRLLHQCGL